MTLSSRNARLLVLAVWTLFLAWLVQAGQLPRYLGPRTAWIVPVGAVVLALGTWLYAHHTRDAPVAARALTLREAAGLGVVAAPILVGVVLGSATLGSLAASTKLAGRGIDTARLAASLRAGGKRIDFLVIRGADEDPRLARERGIVPGRPVRLLGFVNRPATAGEPLHLARFYITCCVADSVAIDVAVLPAGPTRAYARDTWLAVDGVLGRRDGHLVVEGATLREVPEPKHPYRLFDL